MEEVFKPVTEILVEDSAKAIANQKQFSEKQIQAIDQQTKALRDSSLAFQESNKTLHDSLQ